jgi:hypothetical protein
MVNENNKLSKPEPQALAKAEESTQALEKTLDLTETKEGASAFKVDDPFVTLVFNKGSYMPGSEVFYGTPEGDLLSFVEAVQKAAKLHPELAMQYAVWQRDPRQGKGNRSQPPWAIAALSAVPECLNHPRFAELVAKCIVRPDDAIQIVQASTQLLGDNKLPQPLKKGIATGLEKMTAYQLAKYANDRLNLLPQKHEKETPPKLPARKGKATKKELVKAPEPIPTKTLRFVDVLGICKHELSPRLFKLYRYLHAPTRLQAGLLPLLSAEVPQLAAQKQLRATPPQTLGAVADWVKSALSARMTMEQMLSASGMPKGTRKQLKAFTDGESAQKSQNTELLQNLQTQELSAQMIKGEIWQNIMSATVADEERPEKLVPFIGDVAFMRNVRNMHQAGVPLADLLVEAKRRKFSGIYPYQIFVAAQKLEHGSKRVGYSKGTYPAVLPVFDVIFERVAVDGLPRKEDGTLWKILGMADVSGSMLVKLGSPSASATCMDASLSFTAAFALSTRTENYAGLAGTWSNKFYPAESSSDATPLQIIKDVRMHTRGMGGGGTQIFGSMLDLMAWLVERPHVPRPEVLVVLSDMQFHPPATLGKNELELVPAKFRKLIERPEFKNMPPLASAIVLYREIIGSEVSLILWNLAAYSGSPVPSGMDRVLMLSGFDTNSFKIIANWLNAGSPGTAMPVDKTKSVAGGDSGSSFEAVLEQVRQY